MFVFKYFLSFSMSCKMCAKLADYFSSILEPKPVNELICDISIFLSIRSNFLSLAASPYLNLRAFIKSCLYCMLLRNLMDSSPSFIGDDFLATLTGLTPMMPGGGIGKC